MTMTTVTDERLARMGLAALGIPPESHGLGDLVAEAGPAEAWAELLQPGEGILRRLASELDLDEVTARTSRAGARFITPSDDEWPSGLAALGRDEPWGLWAAGESLLALMEPIVITGARACTTYGEHAAVTLAADLAMAGHIIVTGGSFGVDAAATRGALGVGGSAVVVAACGIDEAYPQAHSALWSRVRDTGTVVSEYPPGSTPTRDRFQQRARLMAALSAGVVLVEAAARSGATATTTWAERLHRAVCAVPSPITSSLGCTPHRLIREGRAVLVTSAEDVRAALPTVDLVVDEEPLPHDLEMTENRP